MYEGRHPKHYRIRPNFNMTVLPILNDDPLLSLGAKEADIIHHTLFSPLHTCVRELDHRRKDIELLAITRQGIEPGARELLERCNEPTAVLFRQVATPTHEVLRFLKIAKHLHLKPIILEHHGDKFVSANNKYKKGLAKIPVYQHVGSDGRVIVKYKTVVDFPKEQGKRLRDVVCTNGETLVSLHHRLFKSVTGLEPATICHDGSKWFETLEPGADGYYSHVFSLAIRDFILFENYLDTGKEAEFVKHVVEPAFEKVTLRFGTRPLIARLLPVQRELHAFWDAYPNKVERLIEIN
jgi:hypothetical protein